MLLGSTIPPALEGCFRPQTANPAYPIFVDQLKPLHGSQTPYLWTDKEREGTNLCEVSEAAWSLPRVQSTLLHGTGTARDVP